MNPMNTETCTLKSLWTHVGGLSKPSKMPGFAYGLPARACNVGSKLQAMPGSVCSDCYALKGMYQFPVVQEAQARRLQAITEASWVPAMVRLIGHYSQEVFRWHDSGDLQSMAHLRDIVEIAERLPNTKFWMPTREVNLVREYLTTHDPFPDNLVVRISAFFNHTHPPKYKLPVVLPTSTVHAKGAHDWSTNGLECQAYRRGGECGSCRACWSPKVANVSYPAH